MFLLCSHWLPSVCNIDQFSRLYVNALTESERLNDSEYRSETCSEAELIVVRPERTEPFSPRTHVLCTNKNIIILK